MVDSLPRKALLAYCDPWSARPGEHIRLHVSSVGGAPYQLKLARLTGGAQAAGAPHFIAHEAVRQYPGVERALPAGSYAEAAAITWPEAEGLRIDIIARPTLPVLPRRQAIIAQMREREGFWLGLDQTGCIVLRWGDGAREHELRIPQSLEADRWHSISAALSGKSVALTVAPLGPMAAAAHTVEAPDAFTPASKLALRIAAAHDGEGAATEHFNGRIAGPSLRTSAGAVLQAWDLSTALGSAHVPGHSAALRLINAPTRGVPGPSWNGAVHNPINGADHYDAIHFHDDDLEDACWPADADIALPEDLKSGVYALILETAAERTIVPLFVRRGQDAPAAAITFLASTATYLAYANNRIAAATHLAEMAALTPSSIAEARLATVAQTRALGPSLYDHHHDGSPCMIVSRRRPLLNVSADGATWSLKADLDIIAWLERAGLAYDVVTDEDLHAEGRIALGETRCIVTGAHPEYVSTRMWDALDSHLLTGGRLMYLGGNGFYWRVSHPEDRPWLMECRRTESGARYTECEPGAYHHQFGGELGGLWRRIGRTPQSLVGVGMAAHGFDDGYPYHFTAAAGDPRAAFILDSIDTSAPFGAHGAFGNGGGAAGIEIDRADTALGTPRHALVLASSGPHSAAYVQTPEETPMLHYAISGDMNPNVRADITFFETPSGGAVFSTGSVAWAASLATRDYDNDVARMSTNVLRRFSASEPFTMPNPVKARSAG